MAQSTSLTAYVRAVLAAIPQQATAPYGLGLSCMNGFTVREKDAANPHVVNLLAGLNQLMGFMSFWHAVQLNSTHHQHMLSSQLAHLFKCLGDLRDTELQTPWLKEFLHDESVNLWHVADSCYVARFLADYLDKDIKQLTLKLIKADAMLLVKKLQSVRIQPTQGGDFVDIEIDMGEAEPRVEMLPMFTACESFGNHDGHFSLSLAAQYLSEKSELLHTKVLALAGVADEEACV